MMDNLHLKKELIHKCSEHVDARIAAIQTAMDSIFESKLAETKSSAGDKFETGRAMMHAEEQKLITQMHHAKSDLETISGLPKKTANEQIGPGNLVATSRGHYLISIGVGKVTVDGVIYFCISTASPIGAKLSGKIAGDQIEFNGRAIDILEIS